MFGLITYFATPTLSVPPCNVVLFFPGQELVQCVADFPGGGPHLTSLNIAVARGDLVCSVLHGLS